MTPSRADKGRQSRYMFFMFRRLLACLVVFAIALPSAGVGTVSLVGDSTVAAPRAVADCDCPPGKNDCTSRGKACDCGLVCVARIGVAEPAILTATLTIPPAPGAIVPMTRAAPPSGAHQRAPFRPPRLAIPN